MKKTDKNQQENAEEVKDGFYRSFTPGSYAEEKDEKGNVLQRKVRAAFATDSPVEVYDWTSDDLIRECLRMDGMILPENKQVPLLDNHNRWNGSVSVRGSCRNMQDMNNGTAETDVYFSSLAEDVATLAREGHLTDLSVGYKTYQDKTVWVEPGQHVTYGGKDYDNTGSSLRMAIRTAWKPFEISTTPIGADARTKFRSAHTHNKGEGMDPIKKEEAAPAKNVDVEAIRAAAIKEAREGERARIEEIGVICRELGLDEEFRSNLAKSEDSIEQARQKAVYAAQKKLSVAGPSAPNLRVGADETDKFREAATMAISIRNGIQGKKFGDDKIKTLESSEFRGIDSLQKLARTCLERDGMRGVMIMDNHVVADHILGTGARGINAQGVGDFAYILAAAVNKFLMKGYEDIPTTFDRWVGRQPLNDFKSTKLVNMSNFSDIDFTPEGKSPEWGRFTDKGELIQLFKYTKAFNLSYEALVNDDKGAFSRIPGAMGGAVARKKDRAVYDYLYGTGGVGPTMNEDSLAMFHSTHANLGTTAAPSTASLAEARKLLRSIKLLAPDKDSKTQYTLAPIKWIITGETKWSQWTQILGSPAAYTDSTGNNSQTNPAIINPFANRGIELITTPYLDEKSTTVWYFAADEAIAQHIILGTLAGEEAPQIRSSPSEIGQSRGIVWDLMSIFAVGASDWRGIGKNAGA